MTNEPHDHTHASDPDEARRLLDSVLGASTPSNVDDDDAFDLDDDDLDLDDELGDDDLDDAVPLDDRFGPGSLPPDDERAAHPDAAAPSIAGLLAAVPPAAVLRPAVAIAPPDGVGGLRRDPDLLAAPNRVNARRATRRNVLIASIGFVLLGLVVLVVGPPMHAPVAVPIVLIVAGLLGAALSLVLRRAAREDREPGHGSAAGGH